MDSPQSDDERLQQAGAGEAMISKKMKLLIIMLSLVLIVLLLPLASNHGLPLLKPMGISMLQRLWDAMRFIAMTAAISVGIISTSSQGKDKGSDRSGHPRSASSTHRSFTPSASSSRESINPNRIDNFDLNRSGSPYRRSGSKEMGNSQVSKGKELMDDFSSTASSSDAPPYRSRQEDVYGLGSPSRHLHSRQAPSQEEIYENLKQRPTSSRHRLSASDARFLASRIDEEIEEETNIEHATQGLSPGKSLDRSRKKSSPINEKGLMSNKEIRSADDNYAELSMRKAAKLRLADETHDANSKGHRRSSSVDRRRPIHYDDQGPERPGLKQILMDVSKERAFNGKLSNLSPANKKMPNVDEQVGRPHSVHASVSSSPGNISIPSSRQSMKASVQHHASTGMLPSDFRRVVKHSDAGSMGSSQAVHHKQQEAMKMGLDQIPNQIRQKQDDATKDPNQKTQANTHSNQIVQRRDDHQANMDAIRIKQRQDDLQAKVGSNQIPQKQADPKMAFAQTSQQKADASMGSHPVSQMQSHDDVRAGAFNVSVGVQMQHLLNDTKGSSVHVLQSSGTDQHQEDFQSTLHRANMSSRSKLLLQSSKHSRSALNLEQLEQIGNMMHARMAPPASSGASVKRKKSFSYDFGHDFNPDWLWELEPPPPPGFIDQESVATSRTGADQSSSLAPPKLELNDDSSSTLVQSLVPWRSSAPINISAYPRAPSPLSPPDAFAQSTDPSPGEVNRRADEFINNFNTKLIRQRQESMERQRRYG